MSIATIKAGIKTNLDNLVTDGVLAGATTTDFKKNPLNADVGTYPHAFVMPPALQSEALDNRSNLRTYTFDIMVLFRAEDVDTTSELETKIEAILTEFDNDPTLGGTAMGGVLPVSSAPEPFQHNGRDLIMVIIQLQAKEHVTLTFA
jgi:hypothetical protein